MTEQIQTEMITSDVITSLKKENEQLKNRCFALTQGSLCFFCSIKCEKRLTPFRNDDKAEVEDLTKEQ